MEKSKPIENKWKKLTDNILITNLLIIVIGASLFLLSILLSAQGNGKLYAIFQKLWLPLFIPSLSLFFTAILSEAAITQIRKRFN